MIYIEKNTEQNFVLELDCLHNIQSPNYLFEFIGIVNDSTIYFTTPNISIHTGRYDEFTITDDDTLTSIKTGDVVRSDDSAINFNDGQYDYNVYVTDQVIDINNVTSIIDQGSISTGKMVVVGEDSVLDDVYQ